MTNCIYFSKDHIWANEVDGKIYLGLTTYAQEQLGDIVFINLPDVGDCIIEGKPFGDVESLKSVSDLLAPTSGNVVEINERVLEEPEIVSEDPISNWLIAIEGSLENSKLMTSLDYEEYTK